MRGAYLRAQLIKPTQDQLRQNLVAASKVSALKSQGTAPFQLSATFATFDYKGKPAGEGTLKDTWLKPGTERRELTFRGQSETQIARDGSVRYTGDNFTGSFMERRAIAALLNAVPDEQNLPVASALEYKTLKTGGGVLDCVLAKPKSATDESSPAEAAYTGYCMDAGSHIVRIVQERYDVAITYNKLAKLGEHVIAKDIRVAQNGVTRATLQVTDFAVLPALKESDFVIPANAVDLSREDLSSVDLSVPGSVVAGMKISARTPVYPQSAKQNRISGRVVLSAVIGYDGTIKDLDVVSSPSPDLTDSAITAIKEWRYKPYLLNGVPTQVGTTITVNYAFG